MDSDIAEECIHSLGINRLGLVEFKDPESRFLGLRCTGSKRCNRIQWALVVAWLEADWPWSDEPLIPVQWNTATTTAAVVATGCTGLSTAGRGRDEWTECAPPARRVSFCQLCCQRLMSDVHLNSWFKVSDIWLWYAFAELRFKAEVLGSRGSGGLGVSLIFEGLKFSSMFRLCFMNSDVRFQGLGFGISGIMLQGLEFRVEDWG